MKNKQKKKKKKKPMRMKQMNENQNDMKLKEVWLEFKCSWIEIREKENPGEKKSFAPPETIAFPAGFKLGTADTVTLCSS